MDSIAERLKNKNENFLSNFNLEEFTEKRREKSVILRRNTRLEIQKHKRKIKITPDTICVQEMINICPEILETHLNQYEKLQFLLFYFQKYKDPDSELKLLQAVQNFAQPPFQIFQQDFFKTGLIQVLLDFTVRGTLEQLRIVSLIFLNIASGNEESGKIMVEQGVINSCKQMICRNDLEVSENSLWCLANLAANGVYIKQIMLNQGVLELFIQFYNRSDTPSTPEICLRGISSIIKGKVELKPDQISACISLFKKSIRSYFKDIISYTLIGIYRLTFKGNKILHELIQNQFLQLIFKLLLNQNLEITLDAIKILNNFSASQDPQIPETLFRQQVLYYLLYCIQHSQPSIRKQCYHTLSNLAAGKKSHTDFIVTHPITQFCMKGFTDLSHQVRLQASYFFFTITQTGVSTTCMELLAKGLVKHLIEGLNQNTDPDIIFKLVQTSKNMLNAGAQQAYFSETNNLVLETFVEWGFLPIKDYLHYYQNNEISSMVNSIDQHYFSGKELINPVN